MSAKVYVISDLHIGHVNMALHRGFASVEEHDEFIFSQWNQAVKKGDVVYVLGDLTMEKRNYEFLDKLKGFKRVVLGNHDMGNHTKTLINHVNSVSGMVKYRCGFLTHCPIHPSEFAFGTKFNIHGHVHGNSINDPRYINVSCEAVYYTPVLLDSLIPTS